MKTAILIDGGFFVRRYCKINGCNQSDSPVIMAKNLVRYCNRHIQRENYARQRMNLPITDLYRIFYYDAKPFEGDSTLPISGKMQSF
jgi:hypothetical protein